MKIAKILKKKSAALVLHESTKLSGSLAPVKKYPTIWSKIFYKEYPRYPSIMLPTPRRLEKKNLFEALIERKSVRKFNGEGVSLENISKLLFFSAGINRLEKKEASAKRVYPSGGARYPLEVYAVVKKDSKELKAGIYHYNVKFHALELIKKGGFSKELRIIAGGVNTGVMSSCSVVIAITAVFGRSEIKYGESAYRLILLEAGHLAQNAYLVSSAMTLGVCAIGGFVDDKVNELIEIDIEKEQAVYLLAVGKL